MLWRRWQQKSACTIDLLFLFPVWEEPKFGPHFTIYVSFSSRVLKKINETTLKLLRESLNFQLSSNSIKNRLETFFRFFNLATKNENFSNFSNFSFLNEKEKNFVAPIKYTEDGFILVDQWPNWSIGVLIACLLISIGCVTIGITDFSQFFHIFF